MKKRLISLALCLCMVLTLLPSVALAAESGSNSESSTVKIVTYLDADGVEQTVAAAAAPTGVNESGTIHTWGNSGKTSWYYVDGTAKINSYLTVIGNVNLILCDGANLTVDMGIRIDVNRRLTIYAQSSGENAGKLTAKGSMLSSGGDSGISGEGTLTINGGVIEATCDDAYDFFAKSCGITVDTTINGGKVTAGGGASNYYGGQSYGVFGSLTFNGGTLIAKCSTANGTAQAINGQPTLPAGDYYWRTATDANYTKNDYGAGDASYVELTTQPNGGGYLSYMGWNNSAQKLENRVLADNNYTAVASSMNQLGASRTESWYVVKENVTITGNGSSPALQIIGKVNLILCDGATLTVNGTGEDKIVEIKSESGGLNIYGQSGQTGKLKVSATGSSSYGITCNESTMKVNGGVVEVSVGEAGDSYCFVGSAPLQLNHGTIKFSGQNLFADSHFFRLPGAYWWRKSDSAKYLPSGREAYTYTPDSDTYLELTTIRPAADQIDAITYRTWNETAGQLVDAVCYNAKKVTAVNGTVNMGELGKTTWWYVDGNVTIDGTMRLAGTVHLILCDNAVLTVTEGVSDRIDDSVGSSRNNAELYIYAQREQSETGKAVGKLNVTGSKDQTPCYGIQLEKLAVNGGEISVEASKSGDGEVCGVCVNTLTVNGGQVTAGCAQRTPTEGKTYNSYGIYLQGAMTVNGGTVNATGGAFSVTDGSTIRNSTMNSCGIYADNNAEIVVDGGNLTARGGEIVLTVNRSTGENTTVYSCGIRMNGGDLTVKSGTVVAEGDEMDGENLSRDVPNGDVYSYGVYAEGTTDSVMVEGGSLTATGGTAKTDFGSAASVGIHVPGEVTVTGGRLTATGKDSAAVCERQDEGSNSASSESRGIWCGKLTVSGSEAVLTATAGNANVEPGAQEVTGQGRGSSYGMEVSEALSVTDGTVTATGGTATDKKGSETHSYDGTTPILEVGDIRGSVTLESGTVKSGREDSAVSVYSTGATAQTTVSGGTMKLCGGTMQTLEVSNGVEFQDLLADGYYFVYDSKDNASMTNAKVLPHPIQSAGISADKTNPTYNESVTVTATVVKDPGATGNPTYAWYDGETLLTGATGTSLTTNTLAVGEHKIKCVVTLSPSVVTTNVLTITVGAASLTGVSAEQTGTLTYNGQPQTATVETAATAVNGQSVTFTYSDAQDGTYRETVPAFTSGTHTVYYKADAASHKTASGSFSVTIGKKDVVLRAVDQEACIGSAPDFTKPVAGQNYTVEGLVDGDTLEGVTVTLTCDGDLKKAGSYEIVLNATGEDPRYSYTTENGTLKLSEKPADPVSEPPAYPINVSKTQGGTLTISPKQAKEGDLVTITVTPETGKTLKTLTVTDKNGNKIQLTDRGDGKFTFKMPSGRVEIRAAFTEGETQEISFRDVSARAYYHDAALWAARNSITSGVGNGLFAPELSCTRAQLVTFLWRAAGEPDADYAMDFSDVAEDAYYAEAVRWANSLGIVKGYGNGLFGAKDTITREQMAVILYRFAQVMGQDVGVGEDTNILSYNDAQEISDYAVEAMQWAVGAGIVNGSGGRLMPQSPCTRAQIVTMLYRLLGE